MHRGNEQPEPEAPTGPSPEQEAEDMLDEALEETFPASDPVSAEIPKR